MAANPRLDVVIPTYNGLGEIEGCIEALRRQSIAADVQIHCIDSSSTDGTTAYLKDQRDVSTTVIAQSEFQHGRTRNLGVEISRAEYVAFLTQDAIPASDDWARDILKMFQHFPAGAGLCGRHLPYPQHPQYVKHNIDTFFERMLELPLCVSRDTDPVKWARKNSVWRRRLHFYSDNNSALRRSVWKEIPYPELDYGEDQAWALQILEAGHSKIYAPTAVVYHSHHYDERETYERSKTEAAFFTVHFGYSEWPATAEACETAIQRQQSMMRQWGQDGTIDPAEVGEVERVAEARILGWHDGFMEATATSKTMPNGADGARVA